jgi:hypothetical protein
MFYTVSGSKIGLCPGSALNLNQAKPAPKQLNFLKLGDAGGFIFNGYLTQTEPIFESRAVYADSRINLMIGANEAK